MYRATYFLFEVCRLFADSRRGAVSDDLESHFAAQINFVFFVFLMLRSQGEL